MTAAYDAAEASQQDGQPIEAYLFEGTFRQYRYTSGDAAVTVAGRGVFTPVPIERSNIKAGTTADDGLDLEVRMPVDTALVRDYSFGIAPPDLFLTIYRVHRGTDLASDAAIYWSGSVTSVTVDGHEARLIIPSVFGALLNSEVPTVYYQAPCNHVLFDSGCKVPRPSQTVSTTVFSYEGNTVVVASIGDFPDGHFVGGEVVSQVTGERRMVVAQAGQTLAISFPFARLPVRTPVEVTAGCDHSQAACRRFDNVVNYGGFPYVPAVNPFLEGI